MISAIRKIFRRGAVNQFDAARSTGNGARPYRPVITDDIKRELRTQDFRALLSHSRNLYSNLGPARGAIVDKATYAVGRAWSPKFAGLDAEWGRTARDWLRTQWYPLSNISAGMSDMVTDLLLMSIALDRDGDFGILLSSNGDNWPAYQIIPAHRIWSDASAPAPDGYRWDKGILYNRAGRAVRYRILTGHDMRGHIDVDARSFIHVYDPEWFDQGRGIPAFVHAILDLQDYQTIEGHERTASMIASAISLIEHNEDGGPDPGDLRNALDLPTPPSAGVTAETIQGGSIRYFKANSGGKLEAWQHDRPGDATDRFLDRLLRNAFAGINWPFELVWNAKDSRGANIRGAYARAARTVQDRQDLLRGVAKRVVGYAISKAIQRGDLPQSPEWWKWNFTLPAHITVDAGYDAEADRKDYESGFKTMGDILAKFGKDIEEHLEEKAVEEKLIDAIAARHGINPERLRKSAVQNLQP